MKFNTMASILLLVLSFFSVRPLLNRGFFPIHDDTQVARVVVMGKALREGQFPVRWVSDLGYGYGYPIFNFYGPLPYYVGGTLYAVGVNALSATKAMFILGILLSAFTMYALARSLFGYTGGILSAIFFLYAPYHAVDIYVRGAVGEFWSLAFLPLVALGLLLVAGPSTRKKGVLVGGIGLFGTILSHTILGFITTLFLSLGLCSYWAVRILISRPHGSLLLAHLRILLVGLGLSAFFWLPAVVESSFTNVAGQISTTADYRTHFVCVSQLWNSLWGFGGSAPGCIDGMSFKLGKLHIIAAVLGSILLLTNRKVFKQRRMFLAVTVLVTLASVFFMTAYSKPLWDVIPLFAYFQYPWRFLTFSVFGLSLLSGALSLASGSPVVRFTIVSLLAIGVLFFNAKLFVPQYTYEKSPRAFESETELRFRISKISDEYLPPQVPRPDNEQGVVHDPLPSAPGREVQTEVNTDVYTKFIINAAQDQDITIRRAYFPGWQYWVNGRIVTPQITDGLPTIHIPRERSVVEIRFGNTRVRTLGNLISVAALTVLVLSYGKKTVA